ncbi:iron-sulfur cluster biosynthesis family protein [Ornithinibacillus scapharcae]|uniref:iron-sulfur cluster biosynthesis family protein n=1 Tax=Ornithinibacillus scapharcae TaxID=1147159 RepID=UPI000225AD09|nr:iron-sulfur cluster biosynthesis family protein [Ornithinibacillus scapharcae]
MKLTITELAQEKINELGQEYKYIMLRYDTAGLGCGVNGMPTFSLVNELPEDYMKVENDTIPTVVHKMKSVFFAEDMKLDFINSTFRLSSPDGILNAFIAPGSVISK